MWRGVLRALDAALAALAAALAHPLPHARRQVPLRDTRGARALPPRVLRQTRWYTGIDSVAAFITLYYSTPDSVVFGPYRSGVALAGTAKRPSGLGEGQLAE